MSGLWYFWGSLALLLGGYFVYGAFVEKVFGADFGRPTPVKSRRDGKTIFYSLADSHVRAILDQGVEHVTE